MAHQTDETGTPSGGDRAPVRAPEGQPQPPAEAHAATDLEGEEARALPDKEAMSLISADLAGIDNFAMPINQAIAMNNESAFSYAIADADQIVFLEQQNVETPAPPAPVDD